MSTKAVNQATVIEQHTSNEGTVACDMESGCITVTSRLEVGSAIGVEVQGTTEEQVPFKDYLPSCGHKTSQTEPEPLM